MTLSLRVLMPRWATALRPVEKHFLCEVLGPERRTAGPSAALGMTNRRVVLPGEFASGLEIFISDDP
jgi:hypothetical protein